MFPSVVARFGISALPVVALLAFAGLVQAQDLFGRGDSDCSAALSAADAVAMARALAGETSCANDDCDRDGALTEADLDCTLTCVFGECLIPANAPTVIAVEPDADAISPYTTIHVFGDNFDSDRRLKRVTIDDQAAEIVGGDGEGELLVLVPRVAAGSRQLRVYDGDLGGPPFTITVAPQRSVGSPDTLDSSLTLLDTVLMGFAELDLESHYGDDAALVRDALQTFSETLQQQRAALLSDPNYTAAIRAQLDAAIDSSQVPDRLRDILADIEQLLAATDRRPRQTVVVGAVANNLRDTVAIARGVVALGAVELAATAGFVFGAGVLAGTFIAAASNATVPLVTRIQFFDNAGETGRPFPKRTVLFTGARLFGTRLVIETERGRFTVLADNNSDTSRQFRLPDDSIGFCGRINLYLTRTLPLPGESRRFPSRICPALTEIFGPNPVAPGAHLKLYSQAMSGCFGDVEFEGMTGQTEKVVFNGLDPTLIDVLVPNLKPDTYKLTADVEGFCGSAALPGLVVRDAVTGLEVVCSPSGPEAHTSNLLAPPGTPNRVMCSANLVPRDAPVPPGGQIQWSSSDPQTASIVGSNVGATVNVAANEPGMTDIKATLVAGGRTIADSGTLSPEVVVRDATAPTVTATSSSPMQVAAGGSISVHVNATDNVVISRLRLVAEGPVTNGDQEFPCIDLDKSCSNDFTVHVDSSANSGPITIRAEAFDGFSNKGTSSMLSFTVTAAPDTTCPEVFIESPVDNGVVNAGTMVAVIAHAADEVGVKRFRYSATGDALVTQVMQELPFPSALMTANLRFNFNVKSAAALENITDRTIVINVEAFDEAGNSCGAQTETVRVGGLWEDCDGSISADKPIGRIGEVVTVTAIVTGDLATRVNEVIGYNPGGTYDLMPRGNGTFTLSLTYQGIGKFSFGFTALDHGDPVCEGSILLESIAP